MTACIHACNFPTPNTLEHVGDPSLLRYPAHANASLFLSKKHWVMHSVDLTKAIRTPKLMPANWTGRSSSVRVVT